MERNSQSGGNLADPGCSTFIFCVKLILCCHHGLNHSVNRRRFIQLHIFIFNLVKEIILLGNTDTPTWSSLCFYSPGREREKIKHIQTHNALHTTGKLADKICSNKPITLIFNNLHCGFTKLKIINQSIFSWIVPDFL